MEYLFTINPVLCREGTEIVIYGRGADSKRIFRALLQQEIRVSAFCLRENETSKLHRLFGREVIPFAELRERYPNAWVVVPGRGKIMQEYDALIKAGVHQLIVENITSDDVGILMSEEM